MEFVYRHTQIGYTALLFTLPLVLGALYVFSLDNPDILAQVVFGLMGIPSALVALFMYGMTVTVDDEYVSWNYGLGAFKKKIALEKIVDVEIIENTLAWGKGMQFTSKGALYHVSGFRAVSLRVKTPWKKDKYILLGSDEPEVLRDVLLAQLSKQ